MNVLVTVALVMAVGIINAAIMFFDVAVLSIRPKILWLHLRIGGLGIIHSPYRYAQFRDVVLARRHGISRDELVYGETPIVTGLQILLRAGFRKNHRLIDLGAGRGRMLLAAKWLGGEACGVDINPVHRREVAQLLDRIGIQFFTGAAQTTELNLYTHVYLAWTTWSKKTRDAIVLRLGELKTGTKVITLTWPIVDKSFKQKSRFLAFFSWGMTAVYIYETI